MNLSLRSHRYWLLFLGILFILAIVVWQCRPEPRTTKAHGPALQNESPATAPESRASAVTSTRAPQSAPAPREEAEPQPLDNTFQRHLLDAAVTLASAESRDPQNPARTIKSHLLRTPFKYPHLRSDETWEETPDHGARLIRRELYVADHVMVRFPAAMTPAEVAAWCQARHFVLRHRLKTEPVYLVATETAALGSTVQLLESVRKNFAPEGNPAIGTALAERDFLVFPSVSPNDPSFSQLWGMNNTGQNAGSPDADIDAPEAWEFSTGSADVVVAVIDTGVDSNHLDLRDNIWANPAEIAGNGIDDDANGFVDDRQGWDFYADDNVPYDETGHGTHVSGTIGATGNNGIGVAGACWDVSIVPVRFLGPYGGSTSDGIDSINYSTALGVDLTSNSWGGGSYSSLLEGAITNANTAGILFVAAAGNDSLNNDSSPHYPSSYTSPNIISVASTTATDALSSFSNYGRVSVDLAAPGTSIYSTVPGNLYATYSGTSMATPHVSGALALLRSMAPGLDHLQLKQHLLANVDPISALTSVTSSGGRLNLAKAAALLAGPRIVPVTARIDITSGNGDPYLNPGEQGEFVFVFRNIGSEDAASLSGTLSANAAYPGISVSGSILNIGNLASNTNSAEFRLPFSIGAGVATPTLAGFTLTITDSTSDEWVSQQRLDIHTSSVVSGRVTSADNRQPITTALVTWSGPVSGSTNVDAAGNFSFTAINGTYDISASAPGFVALSQVSVTTPPSPAPLDLRLGVPDLAVSPLSVNASIFAGTTSTATVTLENRGTAPLSWTAVSSLSVSTTGQQVQATGSPSLSGKTIGNIGNTSGILPDLSARGATIVPLTFPLGADDLDGIDVLIIEDAISSAISSDIALIRSWISLGGGLFITADDSSSMGNVNSLLQSAGIQETSLNGYFTGTITAILPHTTTADVASVYLTAYGAQCTLSGSAIPLMQDSSGRTLGGATTMGSGRIIAFGNEVDASISTAGGRLFANQVVDWLSKTVRWLSVPDATGTLAPGESRTLSVQFNAANLNAGPLTGEIIILSNEPGNPRVVIPVSLTVIGSPAIAADPTSLIFPTTFVHGTDSLDLIIGNPGTDTLAISSLAFSNRNPAFSTSVPVPISIPPGANIRIPVSFSPPSPGTFAANLSLSNNSPGSPTLMVGLSGQGVAGPELGLNPDSFALTLPLGARQLESLNILNSGDFNLTWSIDLAPPQSTTSGKDTLAELLNKLDANFADITSLIPNRHEFTDGVTGYSISDGGNDMYDGGNYLTTNLSSSYINYSDGKIVANSASFGPNGRYFTRKHPGLFVFAAEFDGVSNFNIAGDLGADGSGFVSGTVLRFSTGGKKYAGYVKRVHGAGDPSVNHLIIVEDQPGIGHTIPTTTSADTHNVSGLSGTRHLFYLLFSSKGGELVDDAHCEAIMQAFLENVSPSLPWLGFDKDSGSVAPASQQSCNLLFDAAAVVPGQYGATVELASNDPSTPVVQIPVSLTVTSAPVIEVLPNPVEFANVPVNTACQLPVDIHNTGNLPLLLASASIAGSSSFSVAPLDTSVLAPGATTQLLVMFSPTSTGVHSGTLNLSSNSPVSPVLGIPLNGTAVSSGVLKATPASLSLTLESGHTGTLPVTLQNTSSQTVTWSSNNRAVGNSTSSELGGLSVALISSSSSSVTALQSSLTALGATTQFLNYSTLTQASLVPFDVAIIDSNVEYMNSTQIAALSSWLAGGGSILVQSSSSSYSNQNTLFGSYGMSLSYYYHSAAWTPSGTHFLTKGISSVTHDYAYNRITTSGAAVALLREPNGNTTAAISEINHSRVAILTSAVTSFTGDNQLFFERLVGWLGNKVEWLSQSPDSGTLPALGSKATTVNLDAGDLFAGTYAANLVIESGATADPLVIPVRMHVTGTPDIAVPSPVVQFPMTHVGYAKQVRIAIVNEGTAPLLIDSIVSPDPDLVILTPLPAVIAPRSSLEIITEFRPTSIHELTGTLDIASNDPDTPLVRIPVAGNSAIAPAAVTPATIEMTAISGQTTTSSCAIGNTGGSNLSWSLEFSSPALDAPLEVVLPILDKSAAAIGQLIPGKYSFTGGDTGNYISDGGNDMYDSGNYLTTNRLTSGSLDYSDGVIATGAGAFGPGGRYFTRKYDGLFVLAADLDSVNSFRIHGGLGADGAGTSEGAELAISHRGVAWRGFVKRVSGAAGEPSVNHLVIVEDKPGLAHTFSTNTNDDTHEITGLSGTDRLYYLLYAGSNGGRIGDADTTAIMRGFLDSIAVQSPWMTSDPSAGVTAPAGTSVISLTADATHLYAGTYKTFLNIDLNDPVKPSLKIPVTLSVTGTPNIVADPAFLSFPGTIVGASRTLDLTIHNAGTDVLNVSGIQLSGRFSTDQAFPLQVPPGESANIPIEYAPGLFGFETGIATIVSDAANLPSCFVYLYGLGIPPPGIVIDQSQIQVAMGASTTRNESRPITNSGQSSLHWNVGIDYGQALPLFDRIDLTGLTVRIVSETSAANKFDALVSELTRLGADAVEIYYSGFKPSVLETADVLLLDNSYNYLTSPDLQAINDWVYDGGGLMVTDTSSSTKDFNLLTQGSGLQLAYTSSGNPTSVADIRYDITTVGVSSLDTGGYPYSRLLTSAGAKPLALWNNGDCYAGIGSLGTGRIVGACGDLASGTYIGNAGNLRFVTNSLAWLAGRVRNWVEPIPASGITGVNSSSALTFMFDTTGLLPGSYFAEAVVQSDDPAQPDIRIPLTLEVTSAPEITVSATALDFDPTIEGSTADRSITVRNVGHGLLTISSASGSDDFDSDTIFPITLEPGRSSSIKVIFAPQSVGLHQGALVLHSNALTHPNLALPLSGYGLAAPSLTFSPAQVSLATTTNTQQNKELTLGNSGPGHLAWNVVDGFVQGAPLTYPPKLSGVKVGFLTNTSYYAAIRSKLTSYGCSIVNVTVPVQQATLDAIDVLVVDDSWSSSLTAADYTRIRKWVESGGSLMLTSESLTVLQPMLAGTGINPVANYRSSYYLASPSPHLITTGITSVCPYYSEAQFNLGGTAIPLLAFATGDVYAATSRLSRGHVIAVANEAFDSPDFTKGDGERFVVQCLTWLSNRLPWLSFPGGSGSVPPGGSDDMVFRFDSTGLGVGTYHGTLILESNDPAQPMLSIPVTLMVTTSSAKALFAQWQFDHVGGPSAPLGGFTQDWDHDGLSNGHEFYFSINPAGPRDCGHLPAIGRDEGGMFYRYTRLNSIADGLLHIRHSPDLVSWTELSAAGLGHTVTNRDNGDGTTTVELRFVPVSDRGFFSFDIDSP